MFVIGNEYTCGAKCCFMTEDIHSWVLPEVIEGPWMSGSMCDGHTRRVVDLIRCKMYILYTQTPLELNCPI